METDEIVITVVASVSVAVLGYVVNGWRERDFERRRTNYHSKLRTFKDINDAAMRILNLDAAIRLLINGELADAHKNEEHFWQLMLLSSTAREIEAPLGTGVVASISEKFDAISSKWTRRGQEKATEQWVAGTIGSLILLYSRAMIHELTKLNKAEGDSLIVAETYEVRNAVGAVGRCLNKELNLKGGVEGSDAEGSTQPSPELARLVLAMQLAMRMELRLSMRSWFGRRWPFYRDEETHVDPFRVNPS